MLLNAFRRLFSNSQNRKARRACPRPQLLRFEDRITPAAFTYNGSNALTIDLNNANEVLTLTSQGNGAYVFTSTSNFTGTNTTGLTGTGTRTLTITNALNLTDVAITDNASAVGTDVSFGANAGAYVDNFSITLDVAGESVVTVANATSFTGAAGLNVAAARNISITADLSTTTGNIVLDADNGVQQTGNFVGVNISGSGVDVTTTGGNITIEGRGGNSGNNNYGVYVQSGAQVQAGDNGSVFGTASVTGTGGASSGDVNWGVWVSDAGSKITSSGGSVTVIGTGGGTGASSDDNVGVEVNNGGEISAGGTGTVSVTGTGGAAGGDLNIGVFVVDTGSKITSSGGSVTVIGTGGGTGAISDGNEGVEVRGGGVISAGGTGTVLVTGTGGATGSNENYGVYVSGTGSIITSSGGAVTVIGTGGGTGASSFNRGIYILLSGQISAGGTGTVSVTGTAGVGVSTGIDLTSAGSITTNSSGAAVTLTADSMKFVSTSVVSSTGTVTLRNKTAGVAIDLGTETAGQLSLTDAELDRVTAGTLVIGRSDTGFESGVITVSNALTLPSAVSAFQLIGPAGITLNNNVTTIGSQTYTGAVTLGTNTTLNG